MVFAISLNETFTVSGASFGSRIVSLLEPLTLAPTLDAVRFNYLRKETLLYS